MSPAVRVLFHCDDFGKSASVNAAVTRAHQAGILGSTSLMVAGAAFHEAVEIARSLPSLRVGLHLALSEAAPVLPPENLPSLVDPRGNLHADPAINGIRMGLLPAARQQAAAEIAAQFEKFMSTGISPAHVDGHHHLHMHPFVFQQCIPWAERLGFRRIRLAREPGNPLPPRANHHGFIPKMFRHFIFQILSSHAERLLIPSSLERWNGVLGLWETGKMDLAYLKQALPQLPVGTWEIYNHIGSEGCEEELAALLDPQLPAILRENSIQLIMDHQIFQKNQR